MKKKQKNSYQEQKAKKDFLIFDRGLSEINAEKYKDKEIKQKINWFTLYKILFKNILNSKDVIPIDELVLRFNIIRSSLPKYYKGYKGNDSNSSAIIKKFTYHICKNKKKNKNILKDRQNSETKMIVNNITSEASMAFQRRSIKKTKTVKVTHKLNFEFLNKDKDKNNNENNKFKELKNSPLEVLMEDDDLSEKKNINIKNIRKDLKLPTFHSNAKNMTMSGIFKNKLSSKIPDEEKKESKKKFRISTKNNINKLSNNNINNDNNKEDSGENAIILGTPTDHEFPLELSQKRSYNTKPSFFFESLNKIKELTKQEKINTFQKDFTSQILKFNDLYFDPKIDDFYNDKLFNDVKATCDLFINKFTIDSEEEKNLADLDNYL
jgi:hypothetical protein